MGGWANEWADDYGGSSGWGAAQPAADQSGLQVAGPYSLGNGMRGLAPLGPSPVKTQNQFSPISDNATEVPMEALIVRKKKELKKHKKKFMTSICSCDSEHPSSDQGEAKAAALLMRSRHTAVGTHSLLLNPGWQRLMLELPARARKQMDGRSLSWIR